MVIKVLNFQIRLNKNYLLVCHLNNNKCKIIIQIPRKIGSIIFNGKSLLIFLLSLMFSANIIDLENINEILKILI
jgi:hypothetical protein